MSRFLFTLPLIALLAAGTAAVAQDDTATETDTETTTEAPAEEGTSNANQLDMGQEVQEDPSYVKETYGDWQLQCFRSEAEEDPCQMYQLLKDENGGSVAEVSVFRLANGGQVAAGGTFVVPLETLLTQKLTIAVDGGQAKRYDFSFCTQVGCYARVGFTADDVSRFKAGSAAKITIVPALAPDQKVELDMSLSGFTAAFEETSRLNQ